MNNRPTTLHLPAHLPFPITISSLLAKPQDPIRKHDGLLVYKFYALETEEQDDDAEAPKQVTKEIFEQFDSPWEGIFNEWLVKEGTVVASARSAIPACCNCCETSAHVVCLVNRFSRSSNLVSMKSRSWTSAPYVEQTCQCTCSLDCADSRHRKDYTGDFSTQPNISMSHDNFDVKVTYDVNSLRSRRLLTPCRKPLA
jgi:hypothetical protein